MLKYLLPAPLLLLAATAGIAQQGFVKTAEPVYGGVRATVDLPPSQHKRNTGGSDGSGLCVYTSFWHSAIWQSVREVYDFRKYMEGQPGGSYPTKFDQTLKDYCRKKGIPLPAYVQSEGGDVEVLELALKTGRAVAVTYCGHDPNYGEATIAHMVSLLHLDGKSACILDNNFPGTYLWMPRAEFLARWKGVKTDGTPYLARDQFGRLRSIGGGWSIVLLESPPAPYNAKPSAHEFQYGQNCANGRCGIPALSPVAPPVAKPYSGVQPFGLPPTPDHEWRQFDDGVWGWRLKEKVEVRAKEPVGDFPMGGVDSERLQSDPTFSISGKRCAKSVVIYALTGGTDLVDDSERWNLAVVGDDAFQKSVKKQIDALPTALRDKLHVKRYTDGDWQVGQFDLDKGVTLRTPAKNRVAEDVGVVKSEEWKDGSLADLLSLKKGPAPKPEPTPPPSPAPAPNPNPPAPDPVPTPAPHLPVPPVVIVVALLALLYFTRKGNS